MKGLKFALAYLIIISAVGCGSSRKSVKVDSKKSDTLIVKTETIKAPMLMGEFRIEEVCDTVEIEVDGKTIIVPPKAKTFDYDVKVDSLTALLTMRDNALTLSVRQLERVISEKETTIQKQESELSELREIVKTKSDFRTVLILLGVIVFLVVFPEIPYRIKKFVLKLIKGF